MIIIGYLLWLLVMVGNLFGFLTAPIIFPIAYLLKDIKIFRRYLLWIYYDDEDEFGFDVGWWMQDKKEGFWTAYNWAALRNPAWNLQASSRLPYHVIKWLTPSRVLKYIDYDGAYVDNRGPILSLLHSKLGSIYETFNWGQLKLWRYSFAGPVIGKLYIEFQIGWHTRPTFRLKFKKITRIT